MGENWEPPAKEIRDTGGNPGSSPERDFSDLREFLRGAAGRSTAEVIKSRREGRKYRSPAWHFARLLKTRDEFAGLDAEMVTAQIDALVEVMFPGAPAPWVALGLPDFDSCEHRSDPRTDFLNAWDKVEKPFQPGKFVHEAAHIAERKPLDLGERFGGSADFEFRRLLSLCYWLGELAGGEFYLSCRDAGRALSRPGQSVSQVTANNLLQRAERLGFLRSAGAYTERDRAQRKAKSWRFFLPE